MFPPLFFLFAFRGAFSITLWSKGRAYVTRLKTQLPKKTVAQTWGEKSPRVKCQKNRKIRNQREQPLEV